MPCPDIATDQISGNLDEGISNKFRGRAYAPVRGEDLNQFSHRDGVDQGCSAEHARFNLRVNRCQRQSSKTEAISNQIDHCAEGVSFNAGLELDPDFTSTIIQNHAKTVASAWQHQLLLGQ
ncbi:hypothetical protein D9M73_254710 [compost metagenome]